MAGSFALQLTQNTPMSLKVFQTRIYAQAFTVAALCGAAAITATDQSQSETDAQVSSSVLSCVYAACHYPLLCSSAALPVFDNDLIQVMAICFDPDE